MSKILVVGTGPLLESGVHILGAHCLRTWSLVQPLVQAGHEVALFTVPIFGDRPEEMEHAGVADKTYHGFAYKSFLNADDAHNLHVLEEFCQSCRPDALLGINSGPAALAARIQYVAPMWADLFGHVMGEGQGKAHSLGANTHLHYFWQLEESVLRRADHFSVSSRRQGYAVYGELGAVGRLNRHTFKEEFTSFIPPSFDPYHIQNPGLDKSALLEMIPGDAFVVLWSGGFNTWTNVDCLANALDMAMEQCPDMHFVSTGGALLGFDELTYPRFQALVEKSEHVDRYHLLGWVDARELPAVYAQSDLALCVDSPNVETMFGTRTRIVNLIAAGLPVLATRGSEIVEDLERHQALLASEPDNPRSLADELVSAYRQKANLKSLADRSRKIVLDQYNFANNAKMLLEWAANPRFASDNEKKVRLAAETGAPPWNVALSPLEARGTPKATTAPPSLTWRIAERLLGTRQAERLRRFVKKIAAPSPAPANRIVLSPNPHLHSDCLERVLQQAKQGLPIRLVSDGSDPARLEMLCCQLLDEPLAVPLECVLEVEGLEAAHNAIRGDEVAWQNLLYSLALLKDLPELYVGRFTLIALVTLRQASMEEFETLCRILAKSFKCRLEFRLPQKKEESLALGVWPEMLQRIREIDQEQGEFHLPNYSRVWQGMKR